MIDNLKLITPLLEFKEEGDFVMLYIFKRKKDQPAEFQNESQSVRTIKTYCVSSVEYLESKYEEIKQLCQVFNARAYIHLQTQNHKEIGLLMIEELAKRIYNGVYIQKNIFDSVVGKIKYKNKIWIIDIDTKEPLYIERVIRCVSSLREDAFITTIPTKNGVHLITKPFNSEMFNKLLSVGEDVIPEIQRKNPSILFIP